MFSTDNNLWKTKRTGNKRDHYEYVQEILWKSTNEEGIKYAKTQAKKWFLVNNRRLTIYRVAQKKIIHSLLINIFGINLNEIYISGWECNIIY